MAFFENIVAPFRQCQRAVEHQIHGVEIVIAKRIVIGPDGSAAKYRKPDSGLKAVTEPGRGAI